MTRAFVMITKTTAYHDQHNNRQKKTAPGFILERFHFVQ